MSIIKEKKFICDICNREIKEEWTPPFHPRRTFFEFYNSTKWKKHMCQDCFGYLKRYIERDLI